MKDWISIYNFLEDIETKKRKVSTLFYDRACIIEKSGQRGRTFFDDLGMEIQDKNIPKRTYLVKFQTGYVPCRGSVVSQVNPPIIMLSNKVEIFNIGLSDSASYNDYAYSWLINPTLLITILQF